MSGQALVAAAGKPTGVPERVAPAVHAQPVPEPGPVVSFTVNGFTITTSITQSLSVIEQIGVALHKALGGA